MSDSRMETDEEFEKRLKKTFSDKDERRLVRSMLRLFPNIAAKDEAVRFLSEAKDNRNFEEAVHLLGRTWDEKFKAQHADVCGDPDFAGNRSIWSEMSVKFFFAKVENEFSLLRSGA